eukprot:9241569-Prorocentrum_lima.AAC.1
MTSSLVGSEMCIRDSPCSAWWRRGGGGGGARCSRRMGPRVAAVCPGAGAVSYTHLTLPTICSV